MLNIFRGRVPAPNYRLVAPPSGQLETLVVKPEVRIIGYLGVMSSFRDLLWTIDPEDPTVCFRCGPAQYSLRPGPV